MVVLPYIAVIFNQLTDLDALQCLGEENTLPNVTALCYSILYYIGEEVLTLNLSECTDQWSV